jgi:hypothetical protein
MSTRSAARLLVPLGLSGVPQMSPNTVANDRRLGVGRRLFQVLSICGIPPEPVKNGAGARDL